ncbi:MAG: DUF2628 domain-containing protein [Campylobacter sp.]|nr:DUF2628 domain-containing protein [Campylobacter sp.]MBQ7271127.1 DUF2628 domain-containing protein [Campylobacter sp.]MBR0072029.1 DUF2628 domain-containing protein [Campylobacter sp.]
MTEYAKSVFSDPNLLREKLALYIKTPSKIELYAKDCEKFFKAGNGEKLVIDGSTFSFWGFFGTIFFLIYRKIYWLVGLIIAFIILSVIVFPDANDTVDRVIRIGISALCGAFSRYCVCLRFLKILELQDDEMLVKKGGVNYFAYVLFVLFLLLIFLYIKNNM